MERWYQHLAVVNEQRKDAMSAAQKRRMLRSNRSKTQPMTRRLLNQLSQWAIKSNDNRQRTRVPQLRTQRVKE